LLYRYNPLLKLEGKNPLTLDSREPKLDVVEFLQGEKRYNSLKITFPENVDKYWNDVQKFVKERYEHYKMLAGK
jgi:pyruvate-ferredoxin/flavodoxin oxidoreductase